MINTGVGIATARKNPIILSGLWDLRPHAGGDPAHSG
jgi:hypothetical protein